jgi:hypothetical protein
MSPRPLDIKQILASFDSLPDDAIIPDPAAAEVMGISTDTLRRQTRIPQRRLSERRCGRRVGDIRALARGKAA